MRPRMRLYARSIPQRSQDIERAKALLKAAGKEGLTVPLAVSNIAPGAVSTAQVLAQQATAAGVTININNLADAATYFDKYYVQAPFNIDYAATNPMWASIGFFLLPGATYNIEMWKDPTWLALVTKARELEFAKQKAYLGEAQQIFCEYAARPASSPSIAPRRHTTRSSPASNQIAGATASTICSSMTSISHRAGLGRAPAADVIDACAFPAWPGTAALVEYMDDPWPELLMRPGDPGGPIPLLSNAVNVDPRAEDIAWARRR